MTTDTRGMENRSQDNQRELLMTFENIGNTYMDSAHDEDQDDLERDMKTTLCKKDGKIDITSRQEEPCNQKVKQHLQIFDRNISEENDL